jgi:DNA polymerase III alpha subunit (gram-positive type)
MTDLIFLDTETTGLDPNLHEIWEIAWAVNNGDIQSDVVPHSIVTADPNALTMNGYYDRVHYVDQGANVDMRVREALKGNTLVCANPTFDRMMLRRRWGLEPYHYRSIDIESMAVGILQYERPLGLKDIRRDLDALGFVIAEPDHTAAKDVEVLRDCYHALRDVQTRYFNNARTPGFKAKK